MQSPEQQKLLEQLLVRLEPNIGVGASSDMVAASIAISLKRIADLLEHELSGALALKKR